MHVKAAALALAMCMPGGLAFAANPPAAPAPFFFGGEVPDRTIGDDDRRAALQALGTALAEDYVFAEKGREWQGQLTNGEWERRYTGLTSAKAFAETLTRDLQALSGDKHLRVFLAPGMPSPPRPPKGSLTPPPLPPQIAALEGANNFGYSEARRLAGNVGYLKIDVFAPASLSKAALCPAIAFLARTDALIIDVRENRGGDPQGVLNLVSQFLPAGVLVNSIYSRLLDTTTDYVTRGDVCAETYGTEKPVYVLVSGRTFSAGEELAYDLQTQKRGTIVGETTLGGANPVLFRPIGPLLGVAVPNGRAINPITKTNWDGVGVKPDIAVEAGKALLRAHEEALSILLTKTSDPMRRRSIEDAARALKAGP